MTDNNSTAEFWMNPTTFYNKVIPFIVYAAIAVRGIYLVGWTEYMVQGLLLIVIPVVLFVAKQVNKRVSAVVGFLTLFSTRMYIIGALTASFFLNNNPVIVCTLAALIFGGLAISFSLARAFTYASPASKGTDIPTWLMARKFLVYGFGKSKSTET